MEVRIINHHQDNEVDFTQELDQCCILCPEVKNLLKLLLEHSKDENCEGK
jgi:hypothetical protein